MHQGLQSVVGQGNTGVKAVFVALHLPRHRHGGQMASPDKSKAAIRSAPSSYLYRHERRQGMLTVHCFSVRRAAGDGRLYGPPYSNFIAEVSLLRHHDIARGNPTPDSETIQQSTGT